MDHHASHPGQRRLLVLAGTFAMSGGCSGLGPPAGSPTGSPAGSPSARRRELLRTDAGAEIDVIVDGRGPAIVLLPSSLRDSEDFDDLAARLAAEGFKVLRPQPRGMGRSRGAMQGLDLSVLAADVATTVRTLGDGRAVLVGHAFGHFVARVVDLEHPALVHGVVVLGGAARTFPPGLAETIPIASDPAQPREVRLAALRRGFFAPGSDPTGWLDGWHPELRSAYRSAGATPSKDRWWPVSNAPILDLQGSADPWRPPATRNELKDVLGDKVTVQVIEGASHALVPERPAQVTAAIVGWVRALPR